MHGWEGKAFEDIATLTLKRDPERYPFGFASGDGHREYLQWFRNLPEMTQYLARMEPQRWGLQGAQLITMKEGLQEALTGVDVFGLSEDARQGLNELTAPHYRILWWGTFDRLVAGGDAWSAALLARAAVGRDDESARAAVKSWLRAWARAAKDEETK